MRFLTRRFKTVLTAMDGEEGLSVFIAKTPDIVITDIKMPIMDGIEMIKNIKQRSPDTPVVITTAFTDVSYMIKAIELRADAYVRKPIDKDDLFNLLNKILIRRQTPTDDTSIIKREVQLLRDRYEKMKRMLMGAVEAASHALATIDHFTADHQRRVAGLSEAIVAEMSLSEDIIFKIKIAAMLHDIGKMHVPAEILTKPAGLTEIERAVVKTHAMAGYEFLRKIDFTFPLADIVLQHHEKYNGSGYPLGLNGSNILVEARVLNVADVVEAMSSGRPYRPSLGLDMALGEISDRRGVLYDPDVVDACLNVFGKDFKFQE
ncbi:response regulator receiver protein [Candidatus Magnetominusculus xianensis]|uniref:Response regulator receiver protein n=2 Tax=Candidatus Magnetominusculus xianensis TaxID=1748249 RepID=A0ABR5SJY6_9BACT|nr:response regulator receiver protein [Candidatus Magnetominusculus xianensis]MBF0402770.1 response regulator [Nitrospirota bacterium]